MHLKALPRSPTPSSAPPSKHEMAADSVGAHASGWNVRNDPTFLHDIGAITQGEDGVEILLDEQDCRAEVKAKRSKPRTNEFHRRPLNPLRRLREQHEARIADERAARRQLLLLSPRQPGRDLIAGPL